MPYNATTGNAPNMTEVNINGINVKGTNSGGASATPVGIAMTPTYNQSSNAASCDIQINRTETALGSGSHYFLNFFAGTNGNTNEFYVTNAGLCFAQNFVGGVSSAGAVATNSTINTSGFSAARAVPAGAVTGVILQAGTVQGQEFILMNESTTNGNSITFAASGTSNVTGGASVAVAGNASRTFIWNGSTWS